MATGDETHLGLTPVARQNKYKQMRKGGKIRIMPRMRISQKRILPGIRILTLKYVFRVCCSDRKDG